MQTRTKRYRARLKLAKAAAPGPELSRGWGATAPLRRSDWLLVRRAIRDGWPVSHHVQAAIVAGVERVLDDAAIGERWQYAAARMVLAMADSDQTDFARLVSMSGSQRSRLLKRE